jgi:hypothetical protein
MIRPTRFVLAVLVVIVREGDWSPMLRVLRDIATITEYSNLPTV